MSELAYIDQQLREFITGRTCLLGIGSPWWHDDGAGSRIAATLKSCPDLDAVNAGFTPENFLETVVRKHPDTILLVDSTDFGGAPGEARLMNPLKVLEPGLPTHAGSLKLLATYLYTRTRAQVAILAIQPADTSSG
jgi:hydrogenase maturation protease